jgi:hypothetical protein
MRPPRFTVKNLFIILTVAFLVPASVQAVTVKPANNLGLVGYWSFNEGSGTTAADHSGNSNTGTLFNSPTWLMGKVGNALQFNGVTSASGSRVSIPDSPNIRLGSTYTVSAWIKVSSGQGNFRIFFSKNFSAGGYPQLMVSDNNKIDWRANHDTTYGVLSNNAISLGIWYHVVGTYDANAGSCNSKLYVNGVYQTCETLTGAAGNTAAALLIGARSDNSFNFPGAIDEVRVYNRTLGQAEISSLYQASATKYNSQTQTSANGSTLNNGLVARWTLDGADVTDKIYDRIGGNHAYFDTGIATSSTKVIGKLAQALRFSGTQAARFTGVPGTLSAGGTPTLSISAWIKRGTASATGGIVDYAPQYAFDIGVSPCTTNQVKLTKYSVVDLCLGTIPSDTAFHLVTAVWSSGGVSLYIDGVLNATNADTSNFSATTAGIFSIGYASADNKFFTGTIDDIRIYNRSLSASEVKQLYQQSASVVNAPATTLQSGTTLGGNNGLVGYWSFNGADVTDKIYDRVGGNNAYIAGGSATSSMKTVGKLGQALNFNGATYLKAPSINLPRFTVATWIKPNGTQVGLASVIADTYPSYVNYAITFDPGTLDVYGGTFSGNWYETPRATLTSGKWAHVVTTFNGSAIALYVNGTYIGQTAAAITPQSSGTALRIGRRWDDADYYNGAIDEVRIYNRALSASEVKTLYTLGK